MTDQSDVPSGRRRARRVKDQKRVPLSVRVTPQMKGSLERSAERTGRSLTQETEMLLEYATLLLDRSRQEMDDDAEFRKLYFAPPAPELIDRFVRLEDEVAGLRAAVEKGLDRSAEVTARLEARLDRRVAEFEAKLITPAELTTAVDHVQSLLMVLRSYLRKLDEMTRAEHTPSRRTGARPRLIASNGDKDT
jgi:hypothetical protein